MTPGEQALAEAARLEMARVYGSACPERSAAERSADRTDRQRRGPRLRLVSDASQAHRRVLIEQAVARGESEDEIVEGIGAERELVRRVRAEMDAAAAETA